MRLYTVVLSQAFFKTRLHCHRYEYQRRHTAAAATTTTDDKTGAAAAAAPAQVEDLLGLVRQIVPFHMANNAEPEAVDLLVEVGGCCLPPLFRCLVNSIPHHEPALNGRVLLARDGSFQN